MEQELLTKLEEHSRKLEAIERSLAKIRSYFLWTFVITIAVFLLPVAGLIFVIPKFLNMYSSLGSL